MWGGERGEQPSSSVGRWGSGEVQGAGTLHGAGTKKIPERCNDKMMCWGIETMCMQELLQRK